MYKAFFNLTRNPFEITPDPSFLFPTKKHNEALSALYYGVRKQKGFVVLTGEVGTGKTLLLRCLLQLLRKNNDVAYAYVFNGRLSHIEFLQYVAADFGLKATNKNKSELLLELFAYVIDRNRKNLTTVLVVDEAHQLPNDILEEIRLLTNLETPQAKLLQILLVGQPELDDKLDSMELRQLKQRIAFRAHLAALDPGETQGYIERRLELSGANSRASELFPPPTIAAVYRCTSGVPRLINTVCENGLIAAYAKQLQIVTPEIIEEIASEFRLGVVYPPRKKADFVDESELEKATKTMLDIYARMRGAAGAGTKQPTDTGHVLPNKI
jgi:general secretion pathway protein A